MLNKSTHTSLIIIIAAAVLLQTISAVQYYYTHNLLADELELRAESELTTKAVIVKNTLNLAENSLNGHIWDLKRNLFHPDSSYNAMELALRSHPNLTGCWVAYVPNYFPEKGRLFEPFVWWDHGEIKHAEIAAEGRDYTQNRYYKEVFASDAPMWTDLYKDAISGLNLVTYMIPIHDDKGDIVAMFGLDMSTDMLGDTLNYRHVYPSSYNFLLTEKGQLITGPEHANEEKKLEMESIIRQINDSTVKKSLSNSGRSTLLPIEDPDGDEGMVFYTNFKGNPKWQIALVCYDKEVYAKLDTMRRNTGILMIVGLLVLALIIIRFARNDRKLHKANLEKERIDSELHVASQIQQSMLPKGEVSGEKLEVRGFLKPAREVGGDLYDYYIRDEKLFFCIGDVSGKGAPSAMVMAVIHSLFRAFSARESNPARIMQAINEAACLGNESSMFVTLFIGVLDLPTGHLRYCNAGHDAPFIIYNCQLSIINCSPNLPIGIFVDVKYELQDMYLQPESTLFLYTDGLTEAMNSEHKLFGMKRVEQVLGSCVNLQPKEIINTIIEAVHGYVKGAEQSDDLTMLAIRYTPIQFESTLTETLHIKNDVKEISEFSTFMKSILEKLDIEKSLARQLRLAVEEAVVNVVDYAYPAGQEGEIEIRLMSDGKSLKTVIIDSGVAFDTTAVEQTDTTLSVEDRQVGGLGILLVRKMMDSVNYERIEGKNVLTLTKTLNNNKS